MQTKLKNSDMRSSFINLIGRVKDPKGQEPSIVYVLGVEKYEVEAFASQKDVDPPWIVGFSVQGTDAMDFLNVSRLFLDTPMERWEDLEEDLSILARAIRKSRAQKRTRCGDIVPKQTEKVQQVVNEYSDILEKHSISINSAPNGPSLIYSKS